MSFARIPFSLLIRHPRKVVSAFIDSLSHGTDFNPHDHSRDNRGRASRRVRQRAEREFLGEFTPISRTKPEDVFVVGYPKSGNTWFTQMVAGAVFGVLGSKSQGPFVDELITDVHVKTFYRRYSTPTYFRAHHLPRPQYRNVVYLLRDGRDAMVSYWHYRRQVLGQEVDFLPMVTRGDGLFPCKWADHVKAWAKNPYKARMLTIRYEDLLRQPVEEMERFCQFCHLDIDRDFLQLVVESASLKNLQSMSRRLCLHNKRGSHFFRRGVAGSYRDEMPEDVQQAFLADAGEVLQQHQYVV